MVPGLCAAHVRFLARLLNQHRIDSGTRWRKLSPARQALLVLVHLRYGSTFAELGFSFKVSSVTAYRYVGQAIEVLAAQAPQLETVMADRTSRPVTNPGRHHHRDPARTLRQRSQGVVRVPQEDVRRERAGPMR
jgi:Helix-turn-helix of DDE superfamily endonuclease